jgi:hypothetical protein
MATPQKHVVFDFDCTLSVRHLYMVVNLPNLLSKYREDVVENMDRTNIDGQSSKIIKKIYANEVVSSEELKGATAFSEYIFGGEVRIAKLKGVLDRLYQQNVELHISSKGILSNVLAVLENLQLISFFTSIHANAEAGKGTQVYTTKSQLFEETGDNFFKPHFIASLVSNRTKSVVYYVDDDQGFYAEVKAMCRHGGDDFITFYIGSDREAYYEQKKVGTENLTVEKMNELLVLVAPHYKYSTFIADTCARGKTAKICTDQSPDETNLSNLIASMVKDQSNLSIFNEFLAEYGDVAVQHWETVASSIAHPAFGDELLKYLAHHKLNQGGIEYKKAVDLFEKLLDQLYTEEKAGPRFEKLLLSMYPTNSTIPASNGLVRRVVQDTWWQTHRKKRRFGIFRKTDSVSEQIHKTYGIETTPFQLQQSDGTLTQAVKEVLCYLIINQQLDDAALQRYIQDQYGKKVSLNLLSDVVGDLTEEVGVDATRTAEAILAVYKTENLTHTTIFAKTKKNFKVVFLSDAERLKSTLLEINYIIEEEDLKKSIRSQTISNPILRENMVYLLILISTYAKWNLRELITKCKSYNVRGSGNPEASTVLYKPTLKDMSVRIMNEYSNDPVVLNAIREWPLD